jgi:hypothetical protein
MRIGTLVEALGSGSTEFQPVLYVSGKTGDPMSSISINLKGMAIATEIALEIRAKIPWFCWRLCAPMKFQGP